MKRFAPNVRGRALCAGAALTLLSAFAAPALADNKPLSTVTEDGVHITILSLKHTEGETVTLRFELDNQGNKDFSVTTVNLHLLDMAGRREYQAGLGSRCSVDSGKKTECWAMFGAPPPSAKSMTVRFYEKVDLIPGVTFGE